MRYKVKLEMVKTDVASVLVEADSPEDAQRQALAQKTSLHWTYEDSVVRVAETKELT